MKKIKNLVGVSLVIGIFVILALGSTSTETSESTTQVSSTIISETKVDTSLSENVISKEEPVVVTVDELIDALDENALNASKTYKGAYVELTGKLSVIDSSGKYFSLSRLSDDFSFTSVTCYITKNLEDDVASFSKGQEVTIIGKIKSVGEVLGYSADVEKIK